jgi:hypothetical protein
VQCVQAPVGLVAPALHQPARLERVDELDHHRGAHLQPVGQLALRGGPVGQPRERAEVADLDVERRQHLVRALVEAVMGTGEQEPGAAGQRRRRRVDQRAQQLVEPRVLGG